MCYIANLGDSRAIVSKDGNKSLLKPTNDHKPNDVNERKRILESGGKVYQ